MLNQSNLHEYQRDSIAFAKSHKKCALWLGLGLGKTIISLTLIKQLLDEFESNKTLIICPLRVANVSWPDEIKNWGNIDQTYSICTGSKNNRLKKLSENSDIYIINRENVPWLVDNYDWDFDTVIIDESTSFKSCSSSRFKKLKKVINKSDRVIELTATPAPNGLMDIWSQIYLLDGGGRLGKNITTFRRRYFESDYMGYTWTLKKWAEKIIYDKIKDIVFRLDAKDYIKLPNLINHTVKVQLPTSLQKSYNKLEKEFVTEIANTELNVFTAAACSNKLLQFCNGAAYTDSEKNYTIIHDEKLKALEEIIEGNSSENILVAYNYKTDLIRIKQKFPGAVTLSENDDAIKNWNAGKIKLLLAHPASAGHGLNLQKGGSILVWFGLNWSLELYQQFNGRLHRQGQQKVVVIVHIVCENCIDEKVVSALTQKSITQEKLLNYVKNKVDIS